jgi:hypothetical protein
MTRHPEPLTGAQQDAGLVVAVGIANARHLGGCVMPMQGDKAVVSRSIEFMIPLHKVVEH